MAIAKWIPLAAAVEALIESRMAELVDDHTIESYAYAYRVILGALADGTLPSVPEATEAYHLDFVSEAEEVSFPLEEDGTIPTMFWFHLKSVYDAKPGLLVEEEDYAELSPFTSFRESRLKDDGILTGEAGKVLVERAKLPGDLPKRRGERGAQYAEMDRPIVNEAVRLIVAGEPRPAVISRLASRMEGASDHARKARLRTLLKSHPEMQNK